MSSPYRSYKGQSMGRVLHFIYHYCGLHIAERVVVGGGKLYYPKEPDVFATYTMVGDVPIFNFLPGKPSYGFADQAYTTYNQNQVDKLQAAIEDGK